MIISKDHIGSRLLVHSITDKSVISYKEIKVLEVSPSGAFIKYQVVGTVPEIWISADSFVLDEELDKSALDGVQLKRHSVYMDVHENERSPHKDEFLVNNHLWTRGK